MSGGISVCRGAVICKQCGYSVTVCMYVTLYAVFIFVCVFTCMYTCVIQRVFVKFAFLRSFGSEKPFWYDKACPGELVCEVSLIETPLLSVAAGIKEQSFPHGPGIWLLPSFSEVTLSVLELYLERTCPANGSVSF